MATETNNGGTDTNPTPKAKNSKGNVASKDADMGTLAGSVADVWLTKPEITLIWKDAPTFKTEATTYSTSLDTRGDSGKDRPKITSDLKACNKALDAGISKVKKYIDADASNATEAVALYAKFGIVRVGKNYVIPTDRDTRKQAIKLILPAITELGYDAKPFGTAYFTPLIAQFNTLIDSAITTDETVSRVVGNKNKQKDDIRKVLNSLVKVITGNYPDTFKNELRAWGFQKEKY